MTDDSIVNAFDKKVATVWLIITIGAAKSIEHTTALIAREWLDVILVGLDVSIIAAYLGLMMLGITSLIAYKTIGHEPGDAGGDM